MSLRPSSSYLLAYNTLSLSLWSILTLRLSLLIPLLVPHGHVAAIFDAVYSPLLQATQTLAALEIFHSVVRLVRAPIITTIIQVSSRLLMVWGVLFLFSAPGPRGDRPIVGGKAGDGGQLGDWAFVGCLVAWGLTECVRYGFFTLQLWAGDVPDWLVWLRYNTFYVLYPIGIASECTLIYLSLTPAAHLHPAYAWFLKAILVVYIPGMAILFWCIWHDVYPVP